MDLGFSDTFYDTVTSYCPLMREYGWIGQNNNSPFHPLEAKDNDVFSDGVKLYKVHNPC